MYKWGPVSIHCENRCKPATPSRLPLSHQQLLLLTPPLAAVPRDQKHHPAPGAPEGAGCPGHTEPVPPWCALTFPPGVGSALISGDT